MISLFWAVGACRSAEFGSTSADLERERPKFKLRLIQRPHFIRPRPEKVPVSERNQPRAHKAPGGRLTLRGEGLSRFELPGRPRQVCPPRATRPKLVGSLRSYLRATPLFRIGQFYAAERPPASAQNRFVDVPELRRPQPKMQILRVGEQPLAASSANAQPRDGEPQRHVCLQGASQWFCRPRRINGSSNCYLSRYSDNSVLRFAFVRHSLSLV